MRPAYENINIGARRILIMEGIVNPIRMNDDSGLNKTEMEDLDNILKSKGSEKYVHNDDYKIRMAVARYGYDIHNDELVYDANAEVRNVVARRLNEKYLKILLDDADDAIASYAYKYIRLIHKRDTVCM